MQLTSLRMAKGKSVHGSKKTNTQINMSIVLPSFLTQSVKLGAMMIACAAFSFSISWCNLERNSDGLVDAGEMVTSLILTVVTKGGRGHGGRSRFLCKLGTGWEL